MAEFRLKPLRYPEHVSKCPSCGHGSLVAQYTPANYKQDVYLCTQCQLLFDHTAHKSGCAVVWTDDTGISHVLPCQSDQSTVLQPTVSSGSGSAAIPAHTTSSPKEDPRPMQSSSTSTPSPVSVPQAKPEAEPSAEPTRLQRVTAQTRKELSTASVRVIARQVSKLLRRPLLTRLTEMGSPHSTEIVAFLESAPGRALFDVTLSMLLEGLMLLAPAKLAPYTQYLEPVTSELRVEALAGVGDELLDMVLPHITAALDTAVQGSGSTPMQALAAGTPHAVFDDATMREKGVITHE